jgi:hypothetical protein
MLTKMTPEDYAQKNAKQIKTIAKEACENEVKRANLIYRDLGIVYQHKALNNFHCVVMPHFEPFHPESRLDLAGDNGLIKDALERFRSHGLKWNETDVQLCHIGKHPDPKKRTCVSFCLTWAASKKLRMKMILWLIILIL